MELSSHIKVGNLYRFVNQWSVSSHTSNGINQKIPHDSIILILEIMSYEGYKDACGIKMLFNGKVVWRDVISIKSINELKSVF